MPSGQQEQESPSWFTGESVPYPVDSTVLQLFEREAAAAPERVALTFGDATLTYGELNGRANRLAERLRALGVRRGDFVPLVMGNCLELPLSMIALMKLAAPFVPVDETWPRERFEEVIETLAPPVVLQAGKVDPPTDDARLFLVVDAASFDELHSNLHGPSAGLDDLAYGFFTSGSTGTPKCALNVHRGLLNRFVHMTRRFGGGSDVVLQNSRHVFDSSLWQLLWPLTNGSRVVIPERSGILDLTATVEVIRRHQVTMTDFVPSIFNALVDLLRARPSYVEDLASLRQLLVGGEEISVPAVHAFRELLPKAGITNTYGPTEAAIGSIFHDVGDDDVETIPIGTPIDNTYAVIVDDDMRPVGPAAVGEICIGGDCLGLGYLDDPAKTDAAFVPNPFDGIPGSRLYRTGDLGFLRPDGLIHFVGRRDQQVKIGGVRIELSEVEHALATHPGVHEAKVIALDNAGNKVLGAFVTGRSVLTAEILRAHAEQVLSPSLRPKRYFLVDAFPLTPNGKLDRKALAALAAPARKPAGDVALTPAERAIADIWLSLLPCDEVDAADDFFACGGDSLAALRLTLALEVDSGVKLSVKDIVNAPTLRGQAALVSGAGPAVAPSTAPGRDLFESDLRLPADIQVTGAVRRGPVENVLLTGATGFIGAHLLHELLARTSATVYCLVRGTDQASAYDRLIENLREQRLWDDGAAGRVVVVNGDLAEPRFGLSDADYDALTERVDTIVHNGALVNLLLSYQAHRAVNVLSTRQIIRFAVTGPVKRLHYVSTLGVFAPETAAGPAVAPVGEASAVGSPPPGRGYDQSKWVAEHLLEAAAERGLPTATYRLGEVMPHSVHGVPSRRGLADGLVKACIRTGLAFKSPIRMDYTPVDYVSAFVVAAVQRYETGCFHVLQPRAVDFDELLEAFTDHFPLRWVDYREFWSAIDGLHDAGSDPGGLVRLLSALPRPDEAFAPSDLEALFSDSTAHFSRERTRSFLDRERISWPEVGREVFERYAAYYRA
nr:non-ribosomal peptide synthetase [Streptomyces sp. NBC_00899]